MQCACYIFSSVACPALQYLSTFLKNGKIFEKKNTEHKMSGIFLILRRIERDKIIYIYWLFLSVLMYLNISVQIFE